MSMTISAMDARKRFGEILNDAFYRGVSTIIQRKGKPFAKIVPVVSPMNMNMKMANDAPDVRTVKDARARLKGSVLSYIDPMEPIGLDDWEALK